MGRSRSVVLFAFVLVLCLFSPTSATPPAKVVTGVVSNVVSALLKWIWSLSVKSTAKSGREQHTRSMVKFESGYNVETIFDGSKLGIEPHTVKISPNGEFLVLDSENSNIYKISGSMSRHSRPKLLAGSPEGYIGHIDGRPREARMNHPKGLTVDDGGNIYIADTLNMAIRKISDEGVTTIAGGKWGHVGGHVDGPKETSAIREIQLHQDDCTTYDEYDNSFNLGIAVLVAAGFFGYMLALLQWRVRAMFSSPDDPRAASRKKGAPFAAQKMQRPTPSPTTKSVRPPLIPNEDEFEKQDEGFFVSLGRLFLNSGSCMTEIFGGLFSGSKRKPPLQYHQYQQQYQYADRHPNAWPMQESFVIPDEDEPPSIETRTPTPRETYPIMTKELEKPQHFKPARAYLNRWEGGDYEEHQQQHPKLQHQQHQQVKLQQQHQVHTRYSSTPQSYYEQNCETNEIVFGAVQEHDGRRETMVIKAVDYGDPKFSHHNIRPRLNYVGYSHGY
ncbi:CUB and sushi domain-containing protein [Spatholobus suberectus]|nr:CUB and sushi domain-containing protein [Spatholobus suberectus]